MGVLIIVLVIVTLGLAGFLFWFLRKKKSPLRQDFLVLTGVRDMVCARLPVVEAGRYVTDERNGEAWAIREKLLRKDKETGRMTQIVCGWNCNPIDLLGQMPGDVDANYLSALAARVTAESKLGFERKKQRNTIILWAGIIGVILALGIVIPVIMGISKGSIKIPTPKGLIDPIGAEIETIEAAFEVIYDFTL